MDQSVTHNPSTEYVDISLVGMLRVVRQHWVLFTLFVALCTGSAVAYAFLSTPYYKSSTLISPVSDSTPTAGFFGQVLSGFGFGEELTPLVDRCLRVRVGCAA